MSDPISRRDFALAVGAVAGAAVVPAVADAADDKKDTPKPAGPIEAEFTRDYDAPAFKPGWKKPQVNRLLVQDFVIYAHDNLDMVKKLLAKEPALLNAAMDWGGGDWETALGGASHMGRRDIAEFLIEQGARVDLFAATMLGQLAVVKALLTLQPKLIDAKGPHGFGLHWHANAGGEKAKELLEYLQSIKKVELPKFPMKK
ncbi:MAG: ankyrin repeat domain-containing protein [Fimbriiglobus sp.]|jgi:hypothetical protein|nr:ankyrin repeat domain-containing protein [Fimbriiglobus sp.]